MPWPDRVESKAWPDWHFERDEAGQPGRARLCAPARAAAQRPELEWHFRQGTEQEIPGGILSDGKRKNVG